MNYLIRHKSRILSVIQVIVLVQFLAFQGIISFTKHTHQLPDGRLVSHSHLAGWNTGNNSDNNSSGHKHTQGEYFFLYLVTVVSFFILVNIILNLFKNFTSNRYVSLSQHFVRQIHHSISSLRAPPVII